MNYKLVLRITGVALLLDAAALVIPLGVALLYRESITPFLWTILLLAVTGLVLLCCFRGSKGSLQARDGFLTVGLIWALFGAFGALPFRISGLFGSYVDCLFEAISGFTTTGPWRACPTGCCSGAPSPTGWGAWVCWC